VRQNPEGATVFNLSDVYKKAKGGVVLAIF
jgi:hypothetical protein